MIFSLDNYLAELAPLINIDTPTLHQSGIAELVDLFAAKYEAMEGWHVKRIACGQAGYGLEIRNQPNSSHIDVMLIGHMDTVFPVGTVATRPMSVKGERAYGPGVSDMKSGLLNILYGMRSLSPEVLQKLSICICMNPDEEIGSTYSEEWLASVAKQAKRVLVAEAARADGSLVKARKGVARYHIDFIGKAAHAGNEPQKGRSAILELGHWILAISKLNQVERGTTLNTGIVSGGSAANVVAAQASAIVDLRFEDNEEYQRINSELLALSQVPHVDGVTIKLTQEVHVPAMVPSQETYEFMALIEACGADIGLPITWQAVGGGSDGNLTASLGIPTLDGLGPIGAGFHSDDEYLELASVGPRIDLLVKILTRLAA